MPRQTDYQVRIARLLDGLRAAGSNGVAKRGLYKLYSAHADAAELDAILDTLRCRGLVTRGAAPSGHSGRQPQVWVALL